MDMKYVKNSKILKYAGMKYVPSNNVKCRYEMKYVKVL